MFPLKCAYIEMLTDVVGVKETHRDPDDADWRQELLVSWAPAAVTHAAQVSCWKGNKM